MKINPESPDFQQRLESATPSSKTGKAFAEALTSKNVAGGTQATTDPAHALTKDDLADPVKADAAVHRAVEELIEKEFAGMCTPDREHVSAWLRSDPMMRAALLQRLTSST